MAHTKQRRDAASPNAAERFRFICLISVFFWMSQAIKRHSSVPVQIFSYFSVSLTACFLFFLSFYHRFTLILQQISQSSNLNITHQKDCKVWNPIMQMHSIHSSARNGGQYRTIPCGLSLWTSTTRHMHHIMHVIIFSSTVQILAGAKYEALKRTALVPAECTINVQWAQRGDFTGFAHIKIRYWSHFSLSFLPRDEREFSPPGVNLNLLLSAQLENYSVHEIR